MKSLLYIFLFFLVIRCEAQLSPAQSALYYRSSNTPNSAILVIGDSKAMGTNEGTLVGPTPSPGTAFYYDRGSNVIREIQGNDLEFAVNPPNDGSPWPAFAVRYREITGKRPVIIPTGLGATNFALQASGGAGDCWDPVDGTLYAQALTDVASTLALTKITGLDAIIVVLGINDARDIHGGAPQSVAIGDVTTSMTDFYTELQSDFPGVPILISQIGRHETAANDSRIGAIRKHNKQLCISNANLFLIGGELAMWDDVNEYDVDNVHLTQDGQNFLGEMFAMWFENDDYTKWARSIMSSQFDTWSTAHKVLLHDLISADVTSYLAHDMMYVFKNSTQNNMYLDWGFLCMPINNGMTFTLSSYAETSGGTYFIPGIAPTLNALKASQNDAFLSCKVRTATTAAATAATLMGALDGSNSFNMGQTVSSTMSFRANDFTSTTYSTDTDVKDDAHYMTVRSSSTAKALYKNGSSVQSGTVTSVALISTNPFLGCNNNATVCASPITGTYEYCGFGKFSELSASAWYTALEVYLDGY